MSIYLRKNALPIFIEIIFVVSCFFATVILYLFKPTFLSAAFCRLLCEA